MHRTRPQTKFFILTMVAFGCLTLAAQSIADPIQLDPQNPHYFRYHGKPTVLVSTSEHYGAVLNQDFDYETYLDTLASDGLNATRTFTGAYLATPDAVGGNNNVLAPQPGRQITPWQPVGDPADNNYDLSQWNEDYFTRLKNFTSYAADRGITVEIPLFSAFYSESIWGRSPLNTNNNINDIEDVSNTQVYTLNNPKLLDAQDEMTRKVVTELNDFDNVIYQIVNEPYFAGTDTGTKENWRAWQDHTAQVIAQTEDPLANKHLIAENVANEYEKIEDPNPLVSVFTFHYSTPDAVSDNYHLNKLIGDDEDGFEGNAPKPYRTEAWNTLLAGGGLYVGLDYSFTVDHPDGTADFSANPGGGGPVLRQQLAILKNFVDSFDFVDMTPADEVIQGGLPRDVEPQVLADDGQAYAFYLLGGSQVDLDVKLPDGSYDAEWLDTKNGNIVRSQTLNNVSGDVTLVSPQYQDDIALRIKRIAVPEPASLAVLVGLGGLVMLPRRRRRTRACA